VVHHPVSLSFTLPFPSFSSLFPIDRPYPYPTLPYLVAVLTRATYLTLRHVHRAPHVVLRLTTYAGRPAIPPPALDGRANVQLSAASSAGPAALHSSLLDLGRRAAAAGPRAAGAAQFLTSDLVHLSQG